MIQYKGYGICGESMQPTINPPQLKPTVTPRSRPLRKGLRFLAIVGAIAPLVPWNMTGPVLLTDGIHSLRGVSLPVAAVELAISVPAAAITQSGASGLDLDYRRPFGIRQCC